MKTKHSTLPIFAAAVLVAVTPAVHAEESSPWRFDLAANLFMAGLSGDLAAGGNPVSVDASFSDIVDHLEFAAAGRFTIGYDRWCLSTEVSYMGLGASAPAAEIEMDQWLVEPSIGYQVCEMAQVFAGVRYNNINGEIRFNGPLGLVGSGTQDWYDPIIGTQLSLPLVKEKLSLDGRFDVGGFGVGSEITWQVFPYLNWHFAKWGSAQIGYRLLATDYEDGSAGNEFVYDVIVQGVQVGITMHF